MIVNVIVDK